jgi:acyl-CoA synthetase (AMP-forming)/AMP-acid ligase II
MRAHPAKTLTLWSAAQEHGGVTGRFVAGASARLSLSEMVNGSIVDGRGEELRGRSVLIATRDQFIAAMALIELDGIARRIVLYPPDLPFELLPAVIKTASVDAVVSDRAGMGPQVPRVQYFLPYAREIVPQQCDRSVQMETEWILLTSGTLGVPKLVLHTLASLTGAIDRVHPAAPNVVWSTFYDIRRYGGLQIFLRAMLTGSSLVLSSAAEPAAAFLVRAGGLGVTHISGTPSHWRRALMSSSAQRIGPQNVRLSGEIADDAVLAHLRATYPNAQIVHAFASTEAGVAFEVKDGQAGFPAAVLESTPGVEMKIVNQTLCIRSARTADRYLGERSPILKDADGFVDTGDLVVQKEGRCYFAGRRDGLINVGGLKVHPEEVEAVINCHPDVSMSLVKTKKNPVTGSVVVADVVLRADSPSAVRDLRAVRNDILLCCRRSLSAHKIPAAINFVPDLAVAESGKMLRSYA